MLICTLNGSMIHALMFTLVKWISPFSPSPVCIICARRCYSAVLYLVKVRLTRQLNCFFTDLNSILANGLMSELFLGQFSRLKFVYTYSPQLFVRIRFNALFDGLRSDYVIISYIYSIVLNIFAIVKLNENGSR